MLEDRRLINSLKPISRAIAGAKIRKGHVVLLLLRVADSTTQTPDPTSLFPHRLMVLLPVLSYLLRRLIVLPGLLITTSNVLTHH
jgi:hypothetical protein